MTPDEAAYLEQLGFTPSAFSTQTFVLIADKGVVAVVERVPHSHLQTRRWRARSTNTSIGNRPAPVESNELVALIVMAKLEGIL